MYLCKPLRSKIEKLIEPASRIPNSDEVHRSRIKVNIWNNNSAVFGMEIFTFQKTVLVLFCISDVTSLMDVKEEEKQPNCDITRVMVRSSLDHFIFRLERRNIYEIKKQANINIHRYVSLNYTPDKIISIGLVLVLLLYQNRTTDFHPIHGP